MDICYTLLGSDILPPEQLNNPFFYVPHPIALSAKREVEQIIRSMVSWKEEVDKGKMFGVLVVRDAHGAVGYLKAFSGQLLSCSVWEGWVPPVFDYLVPGGYFSVHEASISKINAEIEEMERSPRLQLITSRLASMEKEFRNHQEAFRKNLESRKLQRDERRRLGEDEEALRRESQFLKAEYRRLRKRHEAALSPLRHSVDEYHSALASLRKKRKEMSDALQTWLFHHFVILNGKGEQKSLYDIFCNTALRIPPSGAGECCAPKLLQYALLQGYEPLSLLEFWWGSPPIGEVRLHGECYPACESKCRPILNFMLQGINVCDDPLQEQEQNTALTLLYEDNWLLAVDKPAGMLSVPGKGSRLSAYDILLRNYETPLYSVHRLDMQTSGILLFTKSFEVQRLMHCSFSRREVEKMYYAIIEGEKEVGCCSVISLPLSSDYLRRPYQIVDYEKGKEAVTEYTVLSSSSGRTRLALFPQTGRTHQLRVHCAHPDGLGMPIVGDTLYGHHDERLLLHAARLTFVHPVTGETVVIESECPF